MKGKCEDGFLRCYDRLRKRRLGNLLAFLLFSPDFTEWYFSVLTADGRKDFVQSAWTGQAMC